MQFTAFDLTSPTSDGASAWRPVEVDIAHSRAYQHIIDQVLLADAGGLDAYFFTEHHFNPGFQVVPSPHLLIAALSQVTSRIDLGAMCTNLPLYHPVRVAEEIRMLDALTGGRLQMGFGRGTAPHEQSGYGVERAETEWLFDESFDLVRELLANDQVESYDSGPWSGGGVLLTPEATQRPYPTMWITAVSDKSITKAARLGVNLCTAFLDSDEVARTSRLYRDAWQEARPDEPTGEYGTMQHIFVGETEQEARTLAQPQLNAWLTAGLEAAVAIGNADGSADKGYEDHASYFDKITNLPFEEAIEHGRIIFGTPEQCVEQLLAKAEGQVDMFQGWFQFGGLDFDASNRSLQLFCDEVAPKVRQQLGHTARPV